MLTVPLQINGKDIFTDKTFDVVNPSTGKVIHNSAAASLKEVELAVEAAKTAFPSWAATPPNIKRNIFLKAADILESRIEEVGKWEEEEAGATTFYASGFDVPTAVNGLRDVAGRVSSLVGVVPALQDPSTSAMVLKEPYGVIVGIAPWNATFVLGFRAVTYALAAGNTVVFKASEVSPRSLGVVGTVFREAGLPDGVLNVIQHHPEDAAAVTKALIENPAVKKINFTGSTAVGRIIAELAGKNLKPVLLELGGKAPAIILDDADIPLAARACAMGAFLHSGQICMSTERLLVEKGISAKFADELKVAIEEMFPSSAPALVLMSNVGVKKNKGLLADAESKGASIIFGDANAQEKQEGYMRPVVVKGVKKGMDLYYTESFGPTVSFFEVENEEEAIQIANDTEYGLSSAVFTKDLARGLRLAKRIESGAVHINAMSVHDEPGLPHGGVKSSGFGRFGSHGIEEWVKTKTITYKN